MLYYWIFYTDKPNTYYITKDEVIVNEIKPLTIGEASRISGVNPADITILIMSTNKI